MRQIKFRAWAHSSKVMFNPDSDSDNGLELIDGELHPLPNTSLMQFTGLQDKNGVDIYELMELNKKYIIIYILTGYFIIDIISNEIRNIEEDIYDGWIPDITREYSPLSENQERRVNEYISTSEIKKKGFLHS